MKNGGTRACDVEDSVMATSPEIGALDQVRALPLMLEARNVRAYGPFAVSLGQIPIHHVWLLHALLPLELRRDRS